MYVCIYIHKLYISIYVYIYTDTRTYTHTQNARVTVYDKEKAAGISLYCTPIVQYIKNYEFDAEDDMRKEEVSTEFWWGNLKEKSIRIFGGLYRI